MIFKKRNSASSFDTIRVSSDDIIWTDWTIQKAVKDGFEASGWVYKAVSLISQNASSAPFVVKNKDNEIEWDHPITQTLLNPHPYLTRKQFFELLIQWIELAGVAYFKKVDNSRKTKELWPISPDKIKPVESTDNSEFISGYKIKNNAGTWEKDENYDKDSVSQITLMNPANPLTGISPLQACAKAVDSDVAQQVWNASAMNNRGVVEGVFTFKAPLTKDQSDSLMERIMSKFSGMLNAKKPLVIGSDATYQRMSLTATEMDFLNSRKFNRDEIFIVYGVPPQLAGAQESSTYNNYSESLRIFWDSTIIPLLQLISTQLTMAFKNQLGENGHYIHFDLSDIAAIRGNEKEKADVSKVYFDMGVPFEQLNEKFELGFNEFNGWDLSFNGKEPTKINNTTEERKLKLIPNEKRSAKSELLKRNKIADGPVKDAFTRFLNKQEDAVYIALEGKEDPIEAVKNMRQELIDLVKNVTISVAAQFSNTVVTNQRGEKLNFETRGVLEDRLIEEFLLEEQYILSEASNIDESTIRIITDQVRNAAERGFNTDELRRALDDTGVFSPNRAARIARTEVGTAASIGQISSARVAGADYKTWETAGAKTRSGHIARSGDEVGIEERFSIQLGSSVGPRFPLDPQISVADRVNCDCFMTFRVD